MFEDSTFESTGKIHTRSGGWMLATFLFNGSILLVLILIPLIYPEALPRQMMTMLLEAPPPPPTPQPPPPQKPAQAFHGAPQFDGNQLIVPRRIPITIAQLNKPEAPAPIKIAGMDQSSAAAASASTAFSGQHRVAVAPPAQKGPVHLSSGVVTGLLLKKTPPIYPSIAVATRTQGLVTLQATISTSGTIENLRIISGPVMLQQAALDAVSNWRYRPYLLNGAPVEVETTVNVIFTLNQ